MATKAQKKKAGIRGLIAGIAAAIFILLLVRIEKARETGVNDNDADAVQALENMSLAKSVMAVITVALIIWATVALSALIGPFAYLIGVPLAGFVAWRGFTGFEVPTLDIGGLPNAGPASLVALNSIKKQAAYFTGKAAKQKRLKELILSRYLQNQSKGMKSVRTMAAYSEAA